MKRSRSTRRHFTERVRNKLNKRIHAKWKWYKNRNNSYYACYSFLDFRKMYIINEGKSIRYRCRCGRCLSNRRIQWYKQSQKTHDDFLDYFE